MKYPTGSQSHGDLQEAYSRLGPSLFRYALMLLADRVHQRRPAAGWRAEHIDL